MFFFKGKGLCRNPGTDFARKLQLGPGTIESYFDAMDNQPIHGRTRGCTIWWEQQYATGGLTASMPPEFECKELTLYFRYFPFVFGCIPKQGGVHHDVVFFSLCGNLGVARPPYKGECQGTHVAMPKTNVRNGQRATFQRRFFLWNKLYLIVYD